MNLRDIVSNSAQEHGILSSQHSRALSNGCQGGKVKGNYPKTLHINSNRLQIAVSTILSDETAFGAVLVERRDGNIAALCKGKAVHKLKLALNQRDAFQVRGDDGQPRGGANDKLIVSMVAKVLSIIDKIGIHVKDGVALQEKESMDRTELDLWMHWIPREQLVAIALLRSKLVRSCLDHPSEAPYKNPATDILEDVLEESIMPQSKKQRTLDVFDELAASSKRALDAFESMLGFRSRQDLLMSYSMALNIQREAGGEGRDKAIDEEIAFLRREMAKARASRA